MGLKVKRPTSPATDWRFPAANDNNPPIRKNRTARILGVIIAVIGVLLVYGLAGLAVYYAGHKAGWLAADKYCAELRRAGRVR